MKLTFTIPEIEAGESVRRIGDKRREKIASEMTTTRAFSIEPQRINGDVVSGVILKSIEAAPTPGFFKLRFHPVRCAVFEACSLKGELSALVLDASPQVTIDSSGVQQSFHALRGEGADPVAVERARTAFGRLIKTDGGNSIVRSMIRYLHETSEPKRP